MAIGEDVIVVSEMWAWPSTYRSPCSQASGMGKGDGLYIFSGKEDAMTLWLLHSQDRDMFRQLLG